MKSAGFLQNYLHEIPAFIDAVLKKIPQKKRRLLLLCSGGFIFLAVCCTAAVLAGSGTAVQTQIQTTGTGIPPEELFYPEEPDFLPSLLLEREPRQGWTVEDIKPFWTDPKTGHEEEWREAVEEVIDTLMEGVQ